MGANDVGEQLDAAIDDVVRLEHELAVAVGERDRARSTAIHLEQELAQSESVRSDLRSALAGTALEWHQRGVAVEALSLGVAENAARRRSTVDYINDIDSRGDAGWTDVELLKVLDDIVKLLEGKDL